MKNKNVELTAGLMKDFNDVGECFGSKDKDICFNDKEPTCSASQCKDRELCKALFKGAIPYLEGTKPAPKEEPKAEVKPEVVEWNRATVLEAVLEGMENIGKEAGVTSTATRDKIFYADNDIFVVTKKALKIHRLKSGDSLGIDKELWSTDNRGVVVTYNEVIDFVDLTKKAFSSLYNEANEKVEVKEEEKDLFKNPVKPKVDGNAEAKVKPKTEVKVVKEVKTIEKIASPTFEDCADFDKGEVVKILKITKYSNGFNEVSVSSKLSVEELLKAVGSFLA